MRRLQTVTWDRRRHVVARKRNRQLGQRENAPPPCPPSPVLSSRVRPRLASDMATCDVFLVLIPISLPPLLRCWLMPHCHPLFFSQTDTAVTTAAAAGRIPHLSSFLSPPSLSGGVTMAIACVTAMPCRRRRPGEKMQGEKGGGRRKKKIPMSSGRNKFLDPFAGRANRDSAAAVSLACSPPPSPS